MKAPGGAPKILSEEDKKRLIAEAKTIDELCDAIRKIGPLSKGFLRGKTNVNNAANLIRDSYLSQKVSLLKKEADVIPYLNYGNILKKIKEVSEHKNASTTAATPLKKETLGPVTRKLFALDKIRMKEIDESGNLELLVKAGISIREENKIRSLFPEKIGGQEIALIKKFDKVHHFLEVADKYYNRAVTYHYKKEDWDASISDTTTAIRLCLSFYPYNHFWRDDYDYTGVLLRSLYNFYYWRSFMFEKKGNIATAINDLIVAINLYKEEDSKKGEMEKRLAELIDKSKGTQGSNKIEPVQKLERISGSEKTQLVAQVVANLKLSKFSNYQDYMHAALFLINKHWPVDRSKTNDEVQEIFEMVEEEMKSATSIKQEKVILTEEKKKEIVKDIVSQIKVKYSYGEYSKKDIREYLEDVTKTLVEKLDKESVGYNGKNVIELMLKIIEEWAVSAPLVPAKDLQVSEQVEQLKQEVKKLHEAVKLQGRKGTEVVNVNSTKYVLFEGFKAKINIFSVDIETKIDIGSIVKNLWDILKEIFSRK